MSESNYNINGCLSLDKLLELNESNKNNWSKKEVESFWEPACEKIKSTLLQDASNGTLNYAELLFHKYTFNECDDHKHKEFVLFLESNNTSNFFPNPVTCSTMRISSTQKETNCRIQEVSIYIVLRE